jgi:hypothetical protein
LTLPKLIARARAPALLSRIDRFRSCAPYGFTGKDSRGIRDQQQVRGVGAHLPRQNFASYVQPRGTIVGIVSVARDHVYNSSIQVTFDTYRHLFPQAKQEASSKLEDAMFAKRKEPSVENLVEKQPDQPLGKRDGRRAD